MTIEFIAFDADDTLWHNETIYHKTQDKFKHLLSKYLPVDDLDEQLYHTEMSNLTYFGYGVKSFTLSMIETAARLTKGCVSATDVLEIVSFAKAMLDEPVELLPDVQPVIDRLSKKYHLMIITKGDLLDQTRKLSRSGLEPYFNWVEVVNDKTSTVYAALFELYHIQPKNFLMVGNSLRSDILPVIELGAHAVYIPYHLTWAHEHDIQHLTKNEAYFEIEKISLLPGLVDQWA